MTSNLSHKVTSRHFLNGAENSPIQNFKNQRPIVMRPSLSETHKNELRARKHVSKHKD